MDTAKMPEITRILEETIKRGASDLHLVPGEPAAIRVNNQIERLDFAVVPEDEIFELATSVAGNITLEQIGWGLGDVHRSVILPGNVPANITVSKSLGRFIAIVRFFLQFIPTVEQTMFPESMIEAASFRSGLIVISGPSGSGKTTAAYSLLDHLNSERAGHIYTIEDPVISRFTPKKAVVQQREVGTDVPDTLTGIRAAVNQDVDVLYIHEIQNLEELQAAITFAETGHLVIIVAHATAPEDAIHRIIDVFPEDGRDVVCKALARVLRGVSSQVLMPRSDKPGRTAAYGVLIPDDEMRQAIAQGTDFMARRKPMPEGCQTIADEVKRQKEQGTISEETATKVLSEL